MKQKNLYFILLAILLVVTGVAYYMSNSKTAAPVPMVEEVKLTEMPVTELAISGPASTPEAELSGLAWYGENLILLPQYPNIFGEDGDGQLFYLPKAELSLYIGGARGAALEPRPIKLIAPDLTDQIRNYQGFESIVFSGDRVFMTIEAGEGTDMMGYLISGTINPDLSTLTLDTTKLTEIPPQAKSENHSDESILILDDKIFTFYEVYGKDIVSKPVVHVFDFDLNPQETMPIDNLEYRLTDIAMGFGNTIWGINYFFPGDEDLLPSSDPILERFGTGETHAQYPQVERLIRYQYSDKGLTLVTSKRPIYLTLTEEVRNWEGLVVMDTSGLIMVTDKFPRTILAFVPIPR